MFIFTLNPTLLIQLILAVILPIVVGLVTTKVTSSASKSWLLAGLTLVTSIVTGISVAVAHSAPFDLGNALLLALPQFCISVALHYGLWKPTGVSAAVQNIGS